MATKKISDFTATTTPLSSAVFPIVQSSSNFKVTLANIAANMPDLTATSITSSGALTVSGNATIGGDLTISGDDLFMATNTSGAALIADGTNFNPVVISGDISIGTTGTAAIGTGVIVNADVNTSAAIAFSKMENLTASRALVSDGSGDVSVSAVTSTEIGYLDGVSSSIQSQLDGKASSTYVPTAITVADESSDTTCFPLFTTAATGDLGPKTASGLTFNANTDVLSGTFSGNITGNVTGNVSGTSGSTTGNAATATALETARNIGGVSFDGSANINLPGVNEAGNQNTSGTAAGLTGNPTITVTKVNVGTAATIAANGNISAAGIVTASSFVGNGANITAISGSNIASGTVAAARVATLNQDTTGNAATATILETARTIGGVSFNGSAAINLPGVNEAGNQNTSGTAAGLSGNPTITVTKVNVGTAATISANGNATFAGIVTATSFTGDGTGLTGVASTDNIQTGTPATFLSNVNITGVTTATGGLNVGTAATIFANGNIAAGIVTASSFVGDGSGLSGVGATEEDTAVSSTSATTVLSFAKASYRAAFIKLTITQGSNYQSGKYSLIHDGTTVTVVEENAIATNSTLGTFSGTISGSNVLFQVTMGSSSSATVTLIKELITV